MTLLDGIAAEPIPRTNLPVLETERLILRAPRAEDSVAVATLINDRRVAENLARVPHPYTLTDAEAFIARAQSREEPSFFVTLRDGTIVGGCGLGRLRGDIPDIGYWYGVPYWGRGYATEAARALLDHAFGELGNALLHAGARVSNPASRRVLEKCGFEWTGVVLQRSRALNSSVPCDRFRLDRDRWNSLKSGSLYRAPIVSASQPASAALSSSRDKPMISGSNARFAVAGNSSAKWRHSRPPQPNTPLR
jgi:RimJ/RimL family protein N-acetyltransferase